MQQNTSNNSRTRYFKLKRTFHAHHVAAAMQQTTSRNNYTTIHFEMLQIFQTILLTNVVYLSYQTMPAEIAADLQATSEQETLVQYCHSQNNWGPQNSSQRFSIPVYYWKTAEKPETDPQLLWEWQYNSAHQQHGYPLTGSAQIIQIEWLTYSLWIFIRKETQT
jgi:hypothetical protein